VPVEVGCPLEQRDDAVDRRELEEGVDGSIVEAGGEGAEGEPGAQLRSEARLPLQLVGAQRGRVGAILS
jgi:hypothetical protein